VPITEKLRALLTDAELSILEIGSGSGQHVVSLAKAFPEHTFQPTDIEEKNLESINAWIAHEDANNVRLAKRVDFTDPAAFSEAAENYNALFCFNIIQVVPGEVIPDLFRFASRVTSETSSVFLYGPFKIDGKHTSEGNEQFEAWLKSQNTQFGIHDIADVERAALDGGFRLKARHSMPANNFVMEFTRA